MYKPLHENATTFSSVTKLVTKYTYKPLYPLQSSIRSSKEFGKFKQIGLIVQCTQLDFQLIYFAIHNAVKPNNLPFQAVH